MTKRQSRLLDRARASAQGWRALDLDRFYRAFDFNVEQGSRHTIYRHPTLPGVRAAVTRSTGALHPKYVWTAIGFVEQLLERDEI